MKRKFKNPFKQKEAKLKTPYFILGIILGLLVLLLAFLGIMAWGIYKLDWQGPFIENLVSIVPYPAARVGSSYVSFYDYLKDLGAASKYYEKQRRSGFSNIPSAADLKKIVLEDRLVKNILVQKIAAELGIKITASDVQNKLDEIIKNQGSKEGLVNFLNNFYGLSISEYEKYFILPNLYYDQAELKIENDSTINGEARKKIEEALSKLKNGQKFDDVLKQYGEGGQNQEGGLTGNFLRGELPKTLEDQLFSMSIGSHTEIITLPGSYSIIELVNKDFDKGVLTLKAIMVKTKTLDDLVQDLKNKTRIRIYAY